MRVPTIVLIAVAVLLIPEWAEAGKAGGEKSKLEPGGQEFLKEKHPKLGKDYYVVRMGVGDKCKIVSGEWSSKPAGALGGAPYASKQYAKAALKKFPECKGGQIERAADEKD
jgi:hypothetical protein